MMKNAFFTAITKCTRVQCHVPPPILFLKFLETFPCGLKCMNSRRLENTLKHIQTLADIGTHIKDHGIGSID